MKSPVGGGRPGARDGSPGIKQGPKSASPSPRPRFRLTIDRALTMCGVGAAVGSALFAGVMTVHPSKTPFIVGEEYLGLFAKPSYPPPSEMASLTPRFPARSGPPPQTDPTPTGSIAPTVAKSALTAAGASDQPRLVAISRDGAWFRSRNGFVIAKPGDLVGGLGRIRSIAQVAGAWTVVMEDGSALSAAGTNDKDERFARPLIFGQ
jgi:hypothetical protein